MAAGRRTAGGSIVDWKCRSLSSATGIVSRGSGADDRLIDRTPTFAQPTSCAMNPPSTSGSVSTCRGQVPTAPSISTEECRLQ